MQNPKSNLRLIIVMLVLLCLAAWQAFPRPLSALARAMRSIASADAVQGAAYTMQNVIIQPRAVNASGTVAGWAYFDASKQFHAAVYSSGIVQDLGTLGGTSSEATGINAAGHVVGASTLANGLTHAFLYKNGTMIDLGTLPGGATSQATGINDSGQIVGWSDTLQPNTSYPFPDHAFRYTNGQMTDLGNLGTNFAVFSHATAINAFGQVVGWSNTDDGNRHAFLYSSGAMIDLHTLGGSESVALGVNGLGHVVGWSYTTGDAAARPFLYSGGSLVDLGPVNGYDCTAYSINNADAVVGHATNGPAFLYTPAAGMREINTAINDSQYFFNYAYAINENGQIIASGHNADFSQTQFLLTPSGGIPTPTPTPTPSPTSKTVQFSSASYSVSETGPRLDVLVTRSGDASSSASVSFVTNDAAGLTNCNVFNGIASPRCDYINSGGTLQWLAGDATAKTFSIAIVDDAYAEGNETFSISLNSPSGATLGTQSTAAVTITDNDATNGSNPIDNTNFFVRQQYIDFLGREPDPPGLAGWTSTINNCAPGDTNCDRIHVSQLFFQSAEFQDRGYFVYRFYPVALGRKPDYSEFVTDLARVSGFLNSAQLEAAKEQLIGDFMGRTAFANTYYSLTNQQCVDALLSTAGVTLSSRQAMIDGLNNSTMTRGQVLRQIVESTEVSTKYNHQAYAVMEYFGYLRRQPDGFYLQWIADLDLNNNPRGMVTGFVMSQEYRNRFGP